MGSYQILTDMRRIFIGRDLGLGIVPFEPGQARSLFNRKVSGDKMSVLVLDLRTEYVLDIQDDTEGVGDFETFHADWDLPPFDGHTTVPVPAGEADATDEITLETAP